jgi:hypothetical protein
MNVRVFATLSLLVGLAGSLVSAPVHAQDGTNQGSGEAAAGEQSVVILKFDAPDVDPKVVELLDTELRTAVEGAPSLTLQKGGKVTLNDLLLTAGCAEQTPECLGNLKAVLDADRMIFGSIQRSEDVHLFTLKMFDLNEQVFVREVEDQTLKGEIERLREGVPALVESLLYGDVGTLTVEAVNADRPKVFFDSEPMGRAPLDLEGLPLGEHVVTMRTLSGDEKMRRIVLRKGKTASVVFEFEGGSVEIPKTDAGATAGYRLPGWVGLGVGLAGATVGIIGAARLGGLNSEAESIRQGEGVICDGGVCSFRDEETRERAEEIEEANDGAYTMSVVGFSVGAVGLIAGGVLLYMGYTGSGAESAAGAEAERSEDRGGIRDVRVGAAPTRDGFSVGLGFSF